MPVKFKKSAARCAARMLPYAMATKETLTSYLPRSEVHSTCNFYYFLWLHFADLGSSSSLAFTHALIHAKFPVAIPPLTYDPLSLHHLHIQEGHLHSICQLSYLFLSLFLQTVMREWYQHCISGIITHQLKL